MDNSLERDVFLIIADISGYTHFMVAQRTALVHAQLIISELTKAIIKQVEIPLEISKLEGDAVFLYAVVDDPKSRDDLRREIGRKLKVFLTAFSEKLQELSQSNTCHCEACTNINQLNLKIVVHSGQAFFYELGRFQELSGVDVIIVHRLLKNSVPAKQYILMTAAAYQGLQVAVDSPVTPGVETYEEIGPIKTFVYLPQSTLETREAQPERQYTSWFYRIKNKIFRVLLTKLAFWGLVKLPECHNLPVASDQETTW
jgi:class 3 adenylate cyclase